MKTISKHIVALVAMFVLAPSAFAVDNAGLISNKTVKDNGNGNYTLTLETFATGAEMPVELNVSTPTAFALVLDKSGSMGDEILFSQFSGISGWNDLVANKLDSKHGYERSTYYFYAKYGVSSSSRYDMLYDSDTNQWKYIHNTRLTKYAEPITESVINDLKIHKIFITKCDAMKIAAKRFCDLVYNDEVAKQTVHHLALVTFSAGSAIRCDGMKPFEYSHYKAVMKEIDGLGKAGDLMAGATQVDKGMANALGELHDCACMNRVCILLTDGCPTYGTSFEWNTANAAIHVASLMKRSYNTKVYTVGLWDERDYPGDNTMNYMDWMSSNYPYAVVPQKKAYDKAVWNEGALYPYFYDSNTVTAGPKEFSNYFQRNNTVVTASDAYSLFQHIAQTEIVGGSTTRLSAASEVRDYIASDFKLPAGLTAQDIVIKKVPCTGVAPYTWGTPTVITQSSDGIHAVVDATNNVVTVTGFDYTAEENWVGTHYSLSDASAYVGGYKLVFEVPIQINDTYTGGICRPTNDGSKTALYYRDVMLENYPVPTVDLPVKVTITSKGLDVGDNAVYNVRFTGPRGDADSSIRFQGPYSSTVVATGTGTTETVSKTLMLYPGNYVVSSVTDCKKKYTITVNSDGSYLIKANTTIPYVYQQLANPDPAPEAIARNVFSRKTTKVSYKVTK